MNTQAQARFAALATNFAATAASAMAGESEAERKAREDRERQAEREAERAAAEARMATPSTLAAAILAAVQAKRPTAKYAYNAWGWSIELDGERASIETKAEMSYASSRWGKATGKTRITAGEFGDRTSYPERADGTHNYPAIADKLIAQLDRQIARRKQREAEAANKAVVPRIIEANGLSSRGDKECGWKGGLTVSASSSTDVPVRIEFKLDRAVSEARANEIIAALTALKLI